MPMPKKDTDINIVKSKSKEIPSKPLKEPKEKAQVTKKNNTGEIKSMQKREVVRGAKPETVESPKKLSPQKPAIKINVISNVQDIDNNKEEIEEPNKKIEQNNNKNELKPDFNFDKMIVLTENDDEKVSETPQMNTRSSVAYRKKSSADNARMNSMEQEKKNGSFLNKDSQFDSAYNNMNESDLEEPNNNLFFNNVILTKNVMDEINSDYDSVGSKSRFSAQSSFCSITNQVSVLNDSGNLDKKEEEKKNFKTFCKMVLKIKFEKLPSNHYAQKINERKLWEEAQAKNLSVDQWEEFILKEMNTPITSNNNYYKNPKFKKTMTASTTKKLMDVIEEEN
eukprot:CAMPEP_0170522190 /NCGR_PEP_ID=MMETSP0209-20121228/7642_1 /TAXON_ID=665100 ORGANISM="Litonotus pictus, Strain P1" /NCGR_SAMPLE_ID=MMETSP0209 /ASSEMBLY_ACC=CAM_ASM_000301 /LENGTH=337 /DNA_ID=CAMNT_0010809581 /DNA_START=1158 /DNA_END=2171 /DNA_ORIENTATION=-